MAVVLGALVLGARRARGSGGRLGRSGPRTSARSRRRGRCTTRTRGCSSRCSPTARRPGADTWQGRVPRARPGGGGAGGARQRRARRARGVPRRRLVRARARPRRPSATCSSPAARTAHGAIEAAAEASSRRPAELAGAGGGYDGPLATARASGCGRTSRAAFDRMERAARAGRRRADHHQRLPLRRRAGGPVRPPPGPALGRAARPLAAPPRHRARPRPAAPPTAGWRRTRRASTSSSATLGALALRLHAQRALHASGARRRRAAGATLPDFVPAALRARAGPRRAALERLGHPARRAALRRVELQPVRISRAGAQGIAQFMPGTAAAIGLADPFDAERAIDAQAHLMRDLLRRFPAVPLALAAYNAGPGAVAACGCVPANGETPGYVARILGLMAGAGASGVPARSRCGSSARRRPRARSPSGPAGAEHTGLIAGVCGHKPMPWVNGLRGSSLRGQGQPPRSRAA